jgi:hypothetical protein
MSVSRRRLDAIERRLDAAPPSAMPEEFAALLEARYGEGAVAEDPPAVDGEDESARLDRIREIMRRDRGL